MKRLALIVAALLLSACVDGDGAMRALAGAGYKEVQIKGYSVFGCGKDDFYHTAFEAKGADGKPVSGVVCGGFLKGSTIRMD